MKSSTASGRASEKDSFRVIGAPVSSGNSVRFFDASCDEVKSKLTINLLSKSCREILLPPFLKPSAVSVL